MIYCNTFIYDYTDVFVDYAKYIVVKITKCITIGFKEIINLKTIKMILGVEYRKEKLIRYLETLKQKISKPIFLIKNQSIFYLIMESDKSYGFSCNMFNQIRNIISEEIISISNFSFELELWTKVEPYSVNESFIILLDNFTSNVKKSKNIDELKYLFDLFIINTNRILV